MNRARALVAVVALLGSSCVGSSSTSASGPPEPSTGATPSVAQPVAQRAGPPVAQPVPSPDARIPRAPDRLALELASTTVELRSAIDRWTSDGDPSHGAPPYDVRVLALYQQRLYRAVARDPKIAEGVIAHLPPSVAAEARANVAAGAELLSLASPTAHPNLIRTAPPEPAGVLLGYYEEAQKRFGVAWQVLAAVNYVESKFGRVVSSSSAGAQGPMQFLPSTWAAYGMGGDVHDPRDAILGAANYLHASGAPGDDRRALYAYNPVSAYVDAVLLYAHQMMRDPRTFYAYYNWQVFVLTKHGERRLTGPGA